jgi:hypothetical protein
MNNEELMRVEENKDLSRDMYSGAIVNTNKTAYERAVIRSMAAQKQRDDLREATREINTLKCEMHELKSLLKQLVGKQ